MQFIHNLKLAVAVTAAFAFSAGNLFAAPVSDPIDNAGGPEIIQIDAAFTATDVTFTIDFDAGTAPATGTINGFIDIDIDSNSATGSAGNIGAITGMEYYIDLTEFIGGFVNVFDNTNAFLFTVPINFAASSVSVTVLLASLGGDSGLLDYQVQVGSVGNPSDVAPDTLVASSGPANAPEPGTLVLLAGGLLGVSAAGRKRFKS